MDLSRRRLIVGGAALAVATTALPALPAAAATGPLRLRLPEPTGRYDVGTTTVHLVDRSRPDPYVPEQPYRELMVNITYPAASTRGHDTSPWLTPGWAANAEELMAPMLLDVPPSLVDWRHVRAHSVVDAPVLRTPGGWPVLLHLLGHWRSHCLGRTVIEDLASRGYVVVACDPTYETPVEIPGKGIVPVHQGSQPSGEMTPAELLAYIRKVHRVRLDDAQTVLKGLQALGAGRNPDVDGRQPPAGLAGAVNTARVGVFADGGATGVTAFQLAHEDRRIKAAMTGDIGMSWPTASGPVPMLPVVEHGLRVPVLAVNPSSGYASPDPLWNRMWDGLRGWRRELELRDGGQVWLTDMQTVLPGIVRGLGLPGGKFTRWTGTVDPAKALAARHAYLAAFFDLHLRHRDNHLLDGPSPRHRVIRFVR